MSWDGLLFLKGDRRPNFNELILFYKIINGLTQVTFVPFEGVHVEAYKGTRIKHNMKFTQP